MVPCGWLCWFSRWLRFLLGPLLFGLRVAAWCDKAGDAGKTAVLTAQFTNSDGGEVAAQLLCGEDPAAAAGRIATARRTRTTHGDTVVGWAKQLQQLLEAQAPPRYELPEKLAVGTAQERPRVLKTGGLYSRRANEHLKKKEFALAAADAVRALSRPGIDSTAHDRLSATLSDVLKKAEAQRAQMTQDGDITELFEALDMEDTGMDDADVDLKALKKVYRDLSVKYHPDKNADAAARFNRIRDAYEILSDPMKTMLYDTGGMEIIRKFEGGGGDLERTEGEERQIHVSLEDVYRGTQRKLSRSRRIVCRSCRLHPELPRCKKCTRCPGEMEMRVRWLNDQQYMQEEVEIPSKEKCAQVRDELEVNIERGMGVGERVHFAHMASQLPKKIAGDFQVSVWINDHPMFKRIGNDLVIVVQVSLFEALLGFQRELKHLDGHAVKFGVPEGTVLKPGMALEIEGEGMPLKEDPTSFGRLIVKFEIEFPEAVPVQAAPALETALRDMGLGPKSAAVTRSVKKRSEL